jgi:crcB protein
VKYLIIGIGGFLGANARYLVGNWAAQRWGTEFPSGTLLINVAGSFLLGLFATLAMSLTWSDNARLLIAVGFLGAFTTFSTFAFESLSLLQQGRQQFALAAAYLLGSCALGLAAAALGVLAARLLLALVLQPRAAGPA